MTRNQKIALGCGGAGCLGLIVLAIAGCLIYYFYSRSMARYEAARRDYNFNINLNSNSNSNDDSNSNSNSSSSSASSLSDDDKHKLYHAASITGDTDLMRRVHVALGLLNDDYTPKDEYRQFATAHVAWVFKNMDFLQEVNTAEKGRAYVEEHLP
jgi:hypothetical protein